jgi:isoquinoline 1-oxidoreductase subunit beta
MTMIFVTNGLSRYRFLRTGSASGGGLLLSLNLPLKRDEAQASGAREFSANAFIRIGNDGEVVLTIPYAEMGQGTYTSVTMLIAEELDVELSQIRLERASASDKFCCNPLLAGVQATGGWTAMHASWMPIRQAAAIARTMLVTAAAQRWDVDPAECQAQSGEVIHARSGRRFGYGELAAYAGRLPAPEIVALKRPSEFKLIGTPVKQLVAIDAY